MRILKDGTVKYKPSAYKTAERLSGAPFPLPKFVKGSKVQVYMGAGWSAASVVESNQTHCVVRLTVGNRLITVHDARNIRKHDS
jgi:hypothetical protein